MEGVEGVKKPRMLCLHGYGENAAKLEEALDVWPRCVREKMDMVCVDAPFPIDDPTSDFPRFEWYTLDKDLVPINFDEGIAYIEDCMLKLGPFDGVLGFSEGAIVTATLPGMQAQGVCLMKVGKIKHVILMSGAKLGGRAYPAPKFAENAFSSPIEIPSLHIFGEHDVAKPNAIELLDSFVDPLVIHHNGGHEVPKLDEEGLKIMFEFLKRIQAIA